MGHLGKCRVFPADAGSRAQAALEFSILWLNGGILDGVASAPWGSKFPTSDCTVCVMEEKGW